MPARGLQGANAESTAAGTVDADTTKATPVDVDAGMKAEISLGLS